MPNDPHKLLDRIFNCCEACGEMGHAVANCPDLVAWREYQDMQDAAAEAAYYQVPKGALEK